MLDVIMNKDNVNRDAKSGVGKAITYLEKHKVDNGLCIAAEVLSVAYLGVKTFQAFRESFKKKKDNGDGEKVT